MYSKESNQLENIRKKKLNLFFMIFLNTLKQQSPLRFLNKNSRRKDLIKIISKRLYQVLKKDWKFQRKTTNKKKKNMNK